MDATQAEGGALKLISKEHIALEDDSDARLVKAEDHDTSAWTKALARTAAYSICENFQPKQLRAGAPGDV